jgi:pyridoxamine 5'-phosphate oxidase
LAEAQSAGLPEPNAMVVATATASGSTGARTVLLRGVDERGFAFYTNYGSRKGRELEDNPRASLVFPWYALSRQVIVDGTVERLSPEESDEYFAARPPGSRLSALASPQSEVIESREALERLWEAAAAGNPAGSPPARPDWWGGFRVEPHAVEFWQGGENRLHDRLRFRRDGGEWVLERLAP